ncbi:MAG: FtsX-like permease family protein [Bacteroidota bacterium]
MLKKLLWKDKNKWQIAGAAVGCFIGFFLLLLSLQFLIDFQQLINGKGSGGEQYMIINKPVIAYKSHFTEEELANVAEQAFVKRMGIFTSNEFEVSASSSSFGFYTDLFFESVSDDFLDADNEQWEWQKGQREIPIIISRDYVALYNFGFAPSQGLPQINPQFAKRFTIDININGNGLKRVFKGRIVGYSDRIHTVLVPQNFMDWANETFGEENKPGPNRIIIATDNPYAEEVSQFLEENEYELSSGRLIGSKITSLLKIIVGVVAAIGLIIVLLSVLVFILNFQLIISQSSRDIQLLLQLGYREKQISTLLFNRLLYLFMGTLVSTFVFLFLARFFLRQWFATQGFELGMGLHWSVYVAALLFSFLIIALNFKNIEKSVHRLF